MPLNWNIEKVKDAKNLCFEETEDGKKRMAIVTETLIFATQWVGIDKITERNYEEFYYRLFLADASWGGSIKTKDLSNITPSLNDVKAHIGLWTNACSFPRTEFLKRLRKRVLEKASTQPDHRWVWG